MTFELPFTQTRIGDSANATLPATSDAVPAASSIDLTARTIGVKHVLQSLPGDAPVESGSATTEHLDLLISLITNPSEDLSVASAIYGTSPGSLASYLLSDAGRFVSDIVGVLSTKVIPNAERPLLRLPLDFFMNALTHSMVDAAMARTIAEKLFLPSLLFSKPKQRRAFLAWEVLFVAQGVREGGPSWGVCGDRGDTLAGLWGQTWAAWGGGS
jgi:hypothetical protein